jgi:hypothetical protein
MLSGQDVDTALGCQPAAEMVPILAQDTCDHKYYRPKGDPAEEDRATGEACGLEAGNGECEV